MVLWVLEQGIVKDLVAYRVFHNCLVEEDGVDNLVRAKQLFL